jgi:hypothetical protein
MLWTPAAEQTTGVPAGGSVGSGPQPAPGVVPGPVSLTRYSDGVELPGGV